MLIVVPRGAKHLALLFGFLLACALFWTLELPSPKGYNGLSDATSITSKSRLQEQQKLFRDGADEVVAFALQAPAPNPQSGKKMAEEGRLSHRQSNQHEQNKREQNLKNTKKSDPTEKGASQYIGAIQHDSGDNANNEDNKEKVIIEDAFNAVQLQPLPSDIDTNSNQVKGEI
ncbi:hypothetical protein BIW11_01936 [Tropilaelaps mercedesae]|uniref:Uncharacterized protein n=1 Tax=Tropilaelaps mercedesae TaxID=418985 RepID=A0A1V9X686_9ACAR|nr:hypothetical protein BIW11_01936 [Tropilaelaps mercedesae]